MRFTVTRLCGGKALMAVPEDDVNVDLEKAPGKLGDDYKVNKSDDMMLVLTWNGMEVTVYPQGKIMFFPLSDKDTAVKYATAMLEKISL